MEMKSSLNSIKHISFLDTIYSTMFKLNFHVLEHDQTNLNIQI